MKEKKEKRVTIVLITVIFTLLFLYGALVGLPMVHEAGVRDGEEVARLETNWNNYLNQPFYDFETYQEFNNCSIVFEGFGWREQSHHLMLQCPAEGHMIVYDIDDDYMTQGTYNITNATLTVTKRADIPWDFGGGYLMFPGDWEKIVTGVKT